MEPEAYQIESEAQLGQHRNQKRIYIAVIFVFFILLMFLTASVFTYMTLRNDKIYKGIYVAGIDASGMSKDELKKALDAMYQAVADKQLITLKAKNVQINMGFPDLGFRYNTAETAEKAYAVGHSGNIFKRVYDIAKAGINGISLDLQKTYDAAKVESLVNDFYDKTLVKVREGALFITDDKVTIRSGSHGENIDKEETLESIKNLIEDGKGGTVEPKVIITPASKFNPDEVYGQIISKPVDASYKVENNMPVLMPHVNGRAIDKARLAEILFELEKTENIERSLPVLFTAPEITTDKAAALLFRDELASWSTNFSTETENGKNRGYNIALAVSRINGMVMAPGQIFSYNDVVGPRDVEHGFKPAHVYSGGKIIDGIGGGICQVSSTMYSAILRADLEVVERRNHSFTVGYVPLGQDATAYYGGTDFKFRNSTKWPIKLLASVKKNKVYFSILGTNESPGKTVIISSKILSKTPYTVKYIDDPTLPAGMTKEKLPGMDGYVVETYKTIKQDGKVISETKLHTSVYKVYNEEILRGTKPSSVTSAASSASPASTPTPPAASSGNAAAKPTGSTAGNTAQGSGSPAASSSDSQAASGSGDQAASQAAGTPTPPVTPSGPADPVDDIMD